MEGTKLQQGPESPADLNWSQGAKNPRKENQEGKNDVGMLSSDTNDQVKETDAETPSGEICSQSEPFQKPIVRKPLFETCLELIKSKESVYEKFKSNPNVVVILNVGDPKGTLEEYDANKALEKIMKLVIQLGDDDDFWPKFDEFSFEQGVLVITCHNDESAYWLKGILLHHVTAAVEKQLRGVSQQEFLKFMKVFAFLPGPPRKNIRVINTIIGQNKSLHWHLIRWNRSKVPLEGSGTNVVLDINEKTWMTLEKLSMKAYYGLSRTTFVRTTAEQCRDDLLKPPPENTLAAQFYCMDFATKRSDLNKQFKSLNPDSNTGKKSKKKKRKNPFQNNEQSKGPSIPQKRLRTDADAPVGKKLNKKKRKKPLKNSNSESKMPTNTQTLLNTPKANTKKKKKKKPLTKNDEYKQPVQRKTVANQSQKTSFATNPSRSRPQPSKSSDSSNKKQNNKKNPHPRNPFRRFRNSAGNFDRSHGEVTQRLSRPIDFPQIQNDFIPQIAQLTHLTQLLQAAVKSAQITEQLQSLLPTQQFNSKSFHYSSSRVEIPPLIPNLSPPRRSFQQSSQSVSRSRNDSRSPRGQFSRQDRSPESSHGNSRSQYADFNQSRRYDRSPEPSQRMSRSQYSSDTRNQFGKYDRSSEPSQNNSRSQYAVSRDTSNQFDRFDRSPEPFQNIARSQYAVSSDARNPFDKFDRSPEQTQNIAPSQYAVSRNVRNPFDRFDRSPKPSQNIARFQYAVSRDSGNRFGRFDRSPEPSQSIMRHDRGGDFSQSGSRNTTHTNSVASNYSSRFPYSRREYDSHLQDNDLYRGLSDDRNWNPSDNFESQYLFENNNLF